MRMFLFVWVLVLAGCASNRVDKNIEFNSEDLNSLIVFGLDIRTEYKDPMFTFVQYDVASKSVVEGSQIDRKSMRDTLTDSVFASQIPTGHRYFVFKLPPGAWLLKQARVGNVNLMFSKQTISFSTRQGESHYLGEFRLESNYLYPQLKVLPSDIFGAELEVKHKYPGVKTKLAETKNSKVRFSCAANSGLMDKANCDKIKINF